MEVINLFGGPGIGKSSTAAGLFYLMKRAGINVELVTEVAKDKIWDGCEKLLENQLAVFAEQHHRLWRLHDMVDFVITDSPILFSILYKPEGYPDCFDDLVHEMFNRFTNLNVLLTRDLSREFSKVGRLHDLEQSKNIDIKIKDLLESKKYSFSGIKADNSSHENIFELVTTYIKYNDRMNINQKI